MNNTKNSVLFLITCLILSAGLGFFGGQRAAQISLSKAPTIGTPVITENKIATEEQTIQTIEKTMPAVVSILVTKDIPTYEQDYTVPEGWEFFGNFFGNDLNKTFPSPQMRQNGTEKREIGGGTGFIVSPDGYIITNKHVVSDEDAEYTVIFNNGSKHTTTILARDQFNDIAILKIEGENLPIIEFASDYTPKIGQTVIAIGNALGEFSNTVSTGIISGLSRSITAGDGLSRAEYLTGVLQTDAAINSGNSGGPLLNINGKAIGVNTAVATNGQNIGFAIPINEAQKIYESVKKFGKIIRPWLGIRYILITSAVAQKNNLEKDYGAFIVSGENDDELAVTPNSPANKAGLEEKDIILEVNGEKVTTQNHLAKILSKYAPSDEVILNIYHQGKEKEINVKLGEME